MDWLAQELIHKEQDEKCSLAKNEPQQPLQPLQNYAKMIVTKPVSRDLLCCSYSFHLPAFAFWKHLYQDGFRVCRSQLRHLPLVQLNFLIYEMSDTCISFKIYIFKFCTILRLKSRLNKSKYLSFSPLKCFSLLSFYALSPCFSPRETITQAANR